MITEERLQQTQERAEGYQDTDPSTVLELIHEVRRLQHSLNTMVTVFTGSTRPGTFGDEAITEARAVLGRTIT